jgi:two-component system sensor histidine kinase VanS
MMQSSIRFRLFWGIASLIIFFVVFSWFLNFNFLDKYYSFCKGRALQKEYMEIDSIYDGNIKDIQSHLERMVHSTSAGIVILDRDLKVKYASFPRPPGVHTASEPKDNQFFQFISRIKIWSKPGYHIDNQQDVRRKTQFLYFTAMLKNGEYLWLGTPLPQIRQSVEISNQFFLLTGILTFILGGIVIMIYTKKFTSPILELNAIAQNMARLDFTRTYPVKTHDELGKLGSSINSLSDQLGKSIHELQQANQKLEEDNQYQKKLVEIRKEFISNVSHELKTPIALIQGYAEGLKLNIVDNEEDKVFYCNVIMDEAIKMNKLVRELLDLSEIDSGCLQVEMEVFDLAQLVERVSEKCHLIFKDKGIKLEIEKTPQVFVCADIYRIEQVLVNYLNNAVGHVNDEKVVRISIRVNAGKVRTTVFNSGIPIPAEALEKIWDSFYKVDKARTRAYGGSGLGLSIVRAIMELHQSVFGVDNRADGVEFWFELPLTEAEPDTC